MPRSKSPTPANGLYKLRRSAIVRPLMWRRASNDAPGSAHHSKLCPWGKSTGGPAGVPESAARLLKVGVVLVLPSANGKKVQSGCPAKNDKSFIPKGELASKTAPYWRRPCLLQQERRKQKRVNPSP